MSDETLDPGLAECRRLYWAMVEAARLADLAKLALVEACNVERIRLGLSPEEEVPLWPKKIPA